MGLRLELAHEREECLRFPVLVSFSIGSRIGKVEPEQIDLAEIREELGDLVAHVEGILRHVPPFSGFAEGCVVSLWMHLVHRKLGMVPIKERIIETDAHALRSEGFDERCQDVFTPHRFGRLVVSELRIPEH